MTISDIFILNNEWHQAVREGKFYYCFNSTGQDVLVHKDRIVQFVESISFKEEIHRRIAKNRYIKLKDIHEVDYDFTVES